jgi:hypothetical protein
MLPKSNKRLLVSFDDGSCIVKYYNKDTRNILTSRNYKFIQNQKELTVERDPHLSNHKHENNTKVQTLTLNVTQIRSLQPNKRPVNEKSEVLSKRTRRVKMDYKWLDNLFSDNNEDKNSMIAIQLIINNEFYNAMISDRPISLAKSEKITQLARMGEGH